ncbi:hypothetical protein [Idiomarina abyssalis]|uniref:hypothetical protein n=1 Tax=Idiomarina abyssalis TaxID=86102 RepID=UPI003A8CE393
MDLLTQLHNLLQSSDYRVATYSAFLGAIFGVTFTLVLGFLGRRLQNLTAKRAIRSQISSVADANKIRLNLNIGVVSNELRNLRPLCDRKFTLNPLASLMPYQQNILEFNASFSTNEKYLINLQVLALNAHQSQVENLLVRRASLETEIRKSQHGDQEAELVGLRLEYDAYLKGKYEEIIQYTETLEDFVNQGFWKRLMINIVPLSRLIKKGNVEVG